MTLRFARVDKNNGRDHPLHLRECLLHFHLFFNYLFCMLIFVISLELLKMTWEGGKILWFLSLIFITQSISKKIWKRKLKKIIFPRAKLQHNAAFTQLPIGFGVWGKRSHWPCVMESFLLWGKSWVRLFILMTFNFYFFTQPCSANHKARNPITLLQWLLRHHNFELKNPLPKKSTEIW